jgi:UDP-glucose 4-epimerase
MHILVTGATGRIGAHLTRLLIDEGHTVRAFVLPDDPRIALITMSGVEFVYGRLEDTGSIAEAVKCVEAVYHLAGALTSRGNTDEEFFELNLRGTFNLLMAIRDNVPRIKRFIYASSDAVYDSGASSSGSYLPADETHPRLAGTIYGASKIGAEELCLTFMRGFGIPITILRFGATADAAELIEPQSVFARWLFLQEAINFFETLPAQSPSQLETLAILKSLDKGTESLVIMVDEAGNSEIREWSDARDVAAGCVQALTPEAAIGEAFNLGGVAPFSSAELVEYLAAKLNLPYVTAKLPKTRSAWYISSAKARGIFGYAPRYTIFDMVDEALAMQATQR